MQFTRTVRLALAVALLFFLAACGGDDDDIATEDDTSTTTEATVDEDAGEDEDDTTTTAGGDEDLDYTGSFEVVCTDGTGVAGAADYEAGAASTPVILHLPSPTVEGEYSLGTSVLAEPFALDLDAEEPAADVQLVACASETATEPTGSMCEFEVDGEMQSLEMISVTYDLAVHEATTGEEVGTSTLTAADTECPFFATLQPGEEGLKIEPTDEEIVAAVEAAIG